MKIAFMMLLIGLLTACGTNKDKAEETNTDTTTGKMDNVNEGMNESNDVASDGTVGNEGTNNTAGNKVELADQVANKITELEEVKMASVLVTDNNAYVAVDLKEGTNETEELKTKIADAAKAEDANFKNVYVSANPDFTKQFKDYGDRIRANEPVEGFFDDFTNTVERVFPDRMK